jgi:hypothetical protein
VYGVQYLPGGRLWVRKMPHSFLIVETLNLQFQQVSFGPDVDRKTLSARYDIEAVAGDVSADSSAMMANAAAFIFRNRDLLANVIFPRTR